MIVFFLYMDRNNISKIYSLTFSCLLLKKKKDTMCICIGLYQIFNKLAYQILLENVMTKKIDVSGQSWIHGLIVADCH